MSERTRRHVLASVVVAATGAAAGCSSSSAEEDEEPEPTGTVLGDVTVENLHDESHTVDVLVEFEGEIDHWSTHRLPAGEGGAELEREWPGEPGDLQVTVRLDEETLRQVGPGDLNDVTCLDLTIMVTRSGDLRLLTGVGGAACDDGAADGGSGD